MQSTYYTNTTKPTPSNGLQIRRVKRRDMEIVAQLVSSSADWYAKFVDAKDMDEHEVGEEWADVNYNRRDFYLGYEGNTPVGTISLQYFGEYAYLGYIYLDVKHVGQGYGKQLMQFGELQARQRGMKGMALIAHPEATWAKKAYLKYGFELTETSKHAVTSWNKGVLRPHYEEGFELYLYDFKQRPNTNLLKQYAKELASAL